ncbi:ABC transporter substrate-binding protein [Kineosporia succinea]|uniref:Iron complex transport system substrate-binding protein n=1 Tax=Kineosporia succinea TaxID=84632 RepID=A0ABT9P578_9ACTN|nr:ABC transporter substrate-binding protein [Kineosporia succinea]MDP9827823.1 iron complex transport system substrate-binding protein [Kineosporia succinea]
MSQPDASPIGSVLPSRRHLLLGAGVGLLLAACGTDDSDVVPAAQSSAGAGDFPVTIAHAFGDLTIEKKPERVVIVGFKEADAFLAVGLVPVAVREWFGEKPNAVWPWATEYLKGAKPEVLPRAELDYEQIAALRPDLIVGLSAGLTQDVYDLLVKIAPVLAQPGGPGDYDVTWQQMTLAAGKVAGQPAQALVDDLERRIRQTATDHPEFKGATTVNASSVDGSIYLYSPTVTSSQVLLDLGLTMSDEVTKLTDNADTYYVISKERLDLLDVDVAFWSEAATDPGPVALLENDLYSRLDVRKERRELFLGSELWNGALQFSSVLSLGLVLDELVPQIVLALDGDPSTLPELGAEQP